MKPQSATGKTGEYCLTAPERRPGDGELLQARVLHRVHAALDIVQQAVAGALVHRADRLTLRA